MTETPADHTDTKTTTVARPGAIPWPPILLALAAFAAVLLGRVVPLPWPGMDDLAARIIGIGFGVAGLAIIVWAAMTLNRHRTTIMPHKGASHLVTDGPFRWRRHPIYVGDMFLLLAAAEFTKNIWFVPAALGFALLVTVLQIIPEERHLEATFGDAWREYAARTRRLF